MNRYLLLAVLSTQTACKVLTTGADPSIDGSSHELDATPPRSSVDAALRSDGEVSDDAEVPVDPSMLTGPFFPRLQANIFSVVRDDVAAHEALSRYGAVTTGAAFSTGTEGGFDLGTEMGFGSYASILYRFSDTGRAFPQRTVWEAKRTNPSLAIFVHRGLAHIEAQAFDYGQTSPQRWLVDSLSPRWLATTRLASLQVAVSAVATTQFYFDPVVVQSWVDCGVVGNTAPGWGAPNRFDWYYLTFIDNDANGGRGTVEVMAVKSIDPTTGLVEVAQQRDGSRTIYGAPQTYSVGARAGLVPHSSAGFGSPALLMNNAIMEATRSPDTGMTWVDGAVEYVDRFVLPSRYPDSAAGVYLADGIIMDADDEDWEPYGFRLADDLTGYCLDLDRDGAIDDVPSIERSMRLVYDDYAQRVHEAAAAHGRPALVITNGSLASFPRAYHNGRRFEDTDGFFAETFVGAIRQYQQLFVEGNVRSPVYALLSERDRESLDVHNFDAHRKILGLALVGGDGFYGHDGAHATRIAALDQDWRPTEIEDWFDEFSVDEHGYSSSRAEYSGASRSDGLAWLGRAYGPAQSLRDVDGNEVNAYRRDFEHGIAIFSMANATIDLEGEVQRICGTDPGNDGTRVERLELTEASGYIFRRGTAALICP